MGCISSKSKDSTKLRRPNSIGDVAVFVPGIRIPKSVDFSQWIGNLVEKSLVGHLSALRTRFVVMAAQEAPEGPRPSRKTTQHGGSSTYDLLQSIEDYLPVLLGLVKDGSELVDKVQFAWINQEDDEEETVMANAWYEILSILHLMATLCLSEANLLLLPKATSDCYLLKLTEECRRKSVDVLLKAAGFLNFSIEHVIPKIPPELRGALPIDLSESVLKALCKQALGQGVHAQLGMAIDSPKATLAVKRRLACEMVTCWQQAKDSISPLHFPDGWGGKHALFVKWKCAESQAFAYYYHGIILDEGKAEKSHETAAASLQAAEYFLKESKKACAAFHVMPPLSRNPPPWGSMKYLFEKIPKDVLRIVGINRDLYSKERILQAAPSLPDFILALRPDDYQLPPVDPCWNQ